MGNSVGGLKKDDPGGALQQEIAGVVHQQQWDLSGMAIDELWSCATLVFVGKVLVAASVVAFGPAVILEYVPTKKVDVGDVASAGSVAGRTQRLLLAFAGGGLMAEAALHLLPHLFMPHSDDSHDSDHHPQDGLGDSCTLIAVGFLAAFAIDRFVGGGQKSVKVSKVEGSVIAGGPVAVSEAVPATACDAEVIASAEVGGDDFVATPRATVAGDDASVATEGDAVDTTPAVAAAAAAIEDTTEGSNAAEESTAGDGDGAADVAGFPPADLATGEDAEVGASATAETTGAPALGPSAGETAPVAAKCDDKNDGDDDTLTSTAPTSTDESTTAVEDPAAATVTATEDGIVVAPDAATVVPVAQADDAGAANGGESIAPVASPVAPPVASPVVSPVASPVASAVAAAAEEDLPREVAASSAADEYSAAAAVVASANMRTAGTGDLGGDRANPGATPPSFVPEDEELLVVDDVEGLQAPEPMAPAELAESAEPAESKEPAELAELVEVVELAESREPAESAEPVEVVDLAESRGPPESAEAVKIVEPTESSEPEESAGTLDVEEQAKQIEATEPPALSEAGDKPQDNLDADNDSAAPAFEPVASAPELTLYGNPKTVATAPEGGQEGVALAADGSGTPGENGDAASAGVDSAADTRESEVGVSPRHGGHHGHDGHHGDPEPGAYVTLAVDFLHNIIDGVGIGAAYAIGGDAVGHTTALLKLVHELQHEVGDVATLVQCGMSKHHAIHVQHTTAAGVFLGVAVSLGAGAFPAGLLTTCLALSAGATFHLASGTVLGPVLAIPAEVGGSSQGLLEVAALAAGAAGVVAVGLAEKWAGIAH